MKKKKPPAETNFVKWALSFREKPIYCIIADKLLLIYSKM